MPSIGKKRYEFTVLGIPSPKQSFRFTRTGHRYQTSKVLQEESNARTQIVQQLPKNFTPLNAPLKVSCTFVFPFTKSFSKKKLEEAKAGKTFYKMTKPDYLDNLMKGYMDAIRGVVFVDDSIICGTGEGYKIYGFQPKTIITIEVLDE